MLNGMKMPVVYYVCKTAFSVHGQELSLETSEDNHAFFICLFWCVGGWAGRGFLPFFILRTPLLNVDCIRQIRSKICPLTFSYSPSKKKLVIKRSKSTLFLNVSGDSEAETQL